mmetsp:Transcript_9267/g.20960  ORF Transcript_9267/g.20960 Transcript_9267/m.20960 type:complete len:234 (-) Transcript_9267:146-847(-)
MHHQRLVGPRRGPARGADSGAAPGLGRSQPQGGPDLLRWAVPDRARRPRAAPLGGGLARGRRRPARGGLPARQAEARLAPGRSWGHLQLGRPARWGCGTPGGARRGVAVGPPALWRRRLLDSGLRHPLRAPGQGGRRGARAQELGPDPRGRQHQARPGRVRHGLGGRHRHSGQRGRPQHALLRRHRPWRCSARLADSRGEARRPSRPLDALRFKQLVRRHHHCGDRGRALLSP